MQYVLWAALTSALAVVSWVFFFRARLAGKAMLRALQVGATVQAAGNSTAQNERKQKHYISALCGFVLVLVLVGVILLQTRTGGTQFDMVPSWFRYTHETIAVVSFVLMLVAMLAPNKKFGKQKRHAMVWAFWTYTIVVPLGLCITWWPVVYRLSGGT